MRARGKVEIEFSAFSAQGLNLAAFSTTGTMNPGHCSLWEKRGGVGEASPNPRGENFTIDDHPLALGRGELGIEFTAWISVAIIIERWQTMNALDSDHLERSERVLCVRGIAW